MVVADLHCVWITRPEHQSQDLNDLVKKQGFQVLSFPVIEIQTISDSEKLQYLFSDINHYDTIIFVSRNAVEVTFKYYLSHEKLPQHIKFMAMGGATAAALTDVGIETSLTGGKCADSESLLSLVELKKDSVQGKSILLIRGCGGRELIPDTLIKRGAIVDVAEVYSRDVPVYDVQYLNSIWQTKPPQAIIVTSNTGINNLISLTPESHKATLFKTPLVLMSIRNAEHAKLQGFDNEIRIATTTDNGGLLKALNSLWETSRT